MSNTVTVGPREIAFDALVNLMDDDTREQLHSEMAPCSDQQFADAYLARDAELRKTILSGRF